MSAEHSSRPRRFTATTFLIGGGLLIWIGTFGFIYVFAALACARGFAAMQWHGLGAVPFVSTLACVLGAVATGLLTRYVRRLPDLPQDANARFVRFVAIATGAVALIGMLYLALPPLLFAAYCTAGA